MHPLFNHDLPAISLPSLRLRRVAPNSTQCLVDRQSVFWVLCFALRGNNFLPSRRSNDSNPRRNLRFFSNSSLATAPQKNCCSQKPNGVLLRNVRFRRPFSETNSAKQQSSYSKIISPASPTNSASATTKRGNPNCR